MALSSIFRRPSSVFKSEGTFSPMATMDDLVAGFRLFLQREPEQGAIDHFRPQIAKGMTIKRLGQILSESHEFKNLCEAEVIVVELLDGYSVCLNAKDTDFTPGILASRRYEPHVTKEVLERFKPGQTFVDIGANVGCLALLAAKIAGETGHVIAFEPNPTNVQRLYGGILLNKFENVRVYPNAVSDQRTTFVVAGGTSNGTVNSADGVNVNSTAVFTQSVVPDDELDHLAAIDFIKMDIEGHEPLALRGITKLIKKHKPTLLTEFSPEMLVGHAHVDPEDYLRQVLELYTKLHVISIWGDSADFRDAGSVMDYWRMRNQQVVAGGQLPDQMLHFDIIATND